jgi:hypothetical protein
MPKPDEKGTVADQTRSQRTALSGAAAQLPEVQLVVQNRLPTAYPDGQVEPQALNDEPSTSLHCDALSGAAAQLPEVQLVVQYRLAT